jgi:hypothetical protein
MQGDRHSFRPFRHAIRDQTNVGVSQPIGIVSQFPDPRADGGIAHHGQRDLVELHVGTAEAAKRLHLVAIDPHQIGEILLKDRIGAFRGPLSSTQEIDIGWSRHGDLDRPVRDLPGISELAGANSMVPAELAFAIRGIGIRRVAGIVVKRVCRLSDGHSANRFHEMAEKGTPAILAVGDDPQSGIFLQSDDIADAAILDTRELVLVDLALAQIVTRLD